MNGKLLIVKTGKGKSNIPNVLKVLDNDHIEYERVVSQQPTLNDVFLELTGKELRD
jgi:ABC-2 type transport system ATP-binding protein